MKTVDFLSELTSITENIIETAETKILPVALSRQNFKINEKSWNALECLEHLNLYGSFYIPEFKKGLRKAAVENPKVKATFNSGWVGNYLADMMKITRQGEIKKYSTFKSKNPIYTSLLPNVAERFLAQQHETKTILQQAHTADLDIKIPITLPLIKLKFGDALRFFVYHNERHVVQALRALSYSADFVHPSVQV